MHSNTNLRYLFTVIGFLTLGACGGGGGGGGQSPAPAPVSITVTKPAAAAYMETTDPSVVLEGTAQSTSNIVSVSWANDQGGSGTASGGASWKTTGIELQPGENSITIRATDANGGSGVRTVVIHREMEGTGSVSLSWTAPTHREDGTPLDNLAGYFIRYGRMSGVYDYEIDIDNPGVTDYVVEGLVAGTWYFVVSAYDTDGAESNYSNEIEREVDEGG